MTDKNKIDVLWDDNPVDVTQEANFIWSIANKLRGSYMPDKYGDGRVPRDFRFTHRTAERGKPFRYSVSKKLRVVSARIINKQDFQTDTLRNAR